MKVMKLIFDKSKTRLVGFPYGETTYREQVKPMYDKISDENEQVKLVFPNQIENVASSFAQGFFLELINSIGYEKIEERFIIESSNEKLTAKIQENIY